MAFQILLNFFIAVVWMFLSSSMTVTTFVIGYGIGIILLMMMRRFFPERLYFEWLWAAFKLTLLFIRELTLSNIDVLRVVLRPKLDIQPRIFALPTELKHDWEITLLSSLITLTPGTVVVHVSDDQKILYVHAIDADDVQDAVDSIKNTFEKAIKEVSRP
ncbi:Na+/H+ antiporter subunit E [Sporosarcina ureilytica]|uniref:Na+/H+ antiporter subunit E n=1 Tax=Sporosarcina ureilytica TaxID=298596 RepID=A0A1D8JE59_9BACL|nr:Na+/H+ antiporter subunit E [Sporosarcina ureilytica]AOV06997.1 Na+/H+ antiporter subunit E [Sporosarcina ureilytica]